MRVLLTGASRGIGYAAALALAADAQHQVLALARNADQLAALKAAAKVRQPAHQLVVMAHDLRQPLPPPVLEWLTEQSGLDVLINNAGALRVQSFAETPDALWQELFEINFFAPMRLIRQLLPALRQGQSPHVLNIGSMGGLVGSQKFPGLAAYSASKAALANLTECLAEELREDSIAVNCLALGAVQTEMLDAAFPGYIAPVSAAEMGRWVADFALLGGRIFNGKILPVARSTP